MDFWLLELILKKKERIWQNTAEAVEKRSLINNTDTVKNDKKNYIGFREK